MSIIDLSDKLKINVNTVSRWLNGKNLNNIDNFLSMMYLLEISVEDIKKADIN